MAIECPNCRRTYTDPFFYCPACGRRLMEVTSVPDQPYRFRIEFRCGAWARQFMLRKGNEHLARITRVTLTRDGLTVDDEDQGQYRLAPLALYNQLLDAGVQSLEFEP
jgi:hypothetical protein